MGRNNFLYSEISSLLNMKERDLPLTGKGTSIAILDTGIDKEHQI